MPRIQLKPRSPQFDEPGKKTYKRMCEIPGCPETAEFRAPKDRSLSSHHWFCFDHVREYNKAWNFFSGMNDTEIEEHMLKSLYGDRPTWRYDVDGAIADTLRRKAWQAYNFTDKEPPGYQESFESHNPYTSAAAAHSPEIRALELMGLSMPTDLTRIKKRYKELAKKYHPDYNPGDSEAEELLKQINMAYTVLKLSYEKFEKLNSHKD